MTAPREATYVAFVRAVMIGREGLHRDVLIDMFERAGATDALSHISTGNVSFAAPPVALASIVGSVEADLERLLGRSTPVFVRSLDRLIALLHDDPFADAPFEQVHARLVTFVATEPVELTLPVMADNGDWAVFATGPAEILSVTRAWPGRQPQDPGGVIQRMVGEPVTTRSLGTVERIVRRLDERRTRD